MDCSQSLALRIWTPAARTGQEFSAICHPPRGKVCQFKKENWNYKRWSVLRNPINWYPLPFAKYNILCLEKIKESFINVSVYFSNIFMKLIKILAMLTLTAKFSFKFHKYKILFFIFKLAEIPANFQQTYQSIFLWSGRAGRAAVVGGEGGNFQFGLQNMDRSSFITYICIFDLIVGQRDTADGNPIFR